MLGFEVRIHTIPIGVAWFSSEQLEVPEADGRLEPGPQFARWQALLDEAEAAAEMAAREPDPVKRRGHLAAVASTSGFILVDDHGSRIGRVKEMTDLSTPERPGNHVVRVLFDRSFLRRHRASNGSA